MAPHYRLAKTVSRHSRLANMPTLGFGGAINPASHFAGCQLAAGDEQGSAATALNTADTVSIHEGGGSATDRAIDFRLSLEEH
jgi:hypothetical protein